MSGLARKLLICAAVDGLIIQPLATKGQQRVPAPVKVKYGDAAVISVPRDQTTIPDTAPPNSSFEAFGVIGMCALASFQVVLSLWTVYE
jgi:hypothetical protein